MNLNKLHQNFMESELPYKYSLVDVSNLLMTKYQAKEKDKEDFKDLNSDSFVNSRKIIFCFTIDEDKVLNSILSEEEKKEREYIKKQILNDLELSEEEKQQITIEENSINIIFESIDKKFISNFSIQGGSEQLLNELLVFKGINENDCVLGNEEYETFLIALFNTGYIN
ncbi:hypothetical protein [Niallia sp. 03133]|uniref:hypothetical protein n=1 Tax=Niallia sp. 03133 TaxID=3458060 RepID=UPI004043C480